MTPKIIKIDPYLTPYESDLNNRINSYKAKKAELAPNGSLFDFANGFNYFGFHKQRMAGFTVNGHLPPTECFLPANLTAGIFIKMK